MANGQGPQNMILAGMAKGDFARLRPHLERVDLPTRKFLELRNRKIEHVYFPASGLASVVVTGGSQHTVETGIIGREGMTGLSLLMGSDRAPHEVFMQAPGQGWRVDAELLRSLIETSLGLRNFLLRHAHVFMVQMSFTALANARYKLEERLARWLLMAHDRAEGDEMPLTHEFLSLMLGVRRPGVTAAMNLFEEKELIGCRRGTVIILNRSALEETANGSYGAPESEYERLFGTNGQK